MSAELGISAKSSDDSASLLALALPAPERGRKHEPAGADAEARYRALVCNLPDAVIAIYDRDLRGVSIEGPVLSSGRLDPATFRGAPLSASVGAADLALLEPHYLSALDGAQSSVEYSPEGLGRTFQLEIVPYRPDGGERIEGVFTLARDVTERKRMEAEGEQRGRQQSAVAELGVAALEGMEVAALLDEACSIVSRTLGTEFCELLELTADREAMVLRAGTGWQGGLVRSAVFPIDSAFHAGFTWGSLGQVVVSDYSVEARFRPTSLLRDHGVVSGVSVIVGGKVGQFGVLGAHTSAARHFRPDEVHFLRSIANVLAEAIGRNASEERIRSQALHDPLTGLPNRTLLLERMTHWMEGRAPSSDARAAVLFVDLDNFKVVNDALGHGAGDRLLCTVAERLDRALRPSATVARVGVDEFVVFCEDVRLDHDVVAVVDRLHRALAEPIDLDERSQHVTASIGVALGDQRVDPDTLIRNADAAMHRAKEHGGARYELFDEAMRVRSLEWLETEAALRHAIEHGELQNAYQPIVSVLDGAVVGFEALVRWHRPGHGVVAPPAFIPVAEQSGLIVPLGLVVLEAACREALAWQRVRPRGSEPLRVSVNLSPRQLSHPDLVATVARVLDDTGLDPALLSLEITESALVEENAGALERLGQLKRLGIRLDLDDFGTGYSSLTYVRSYPIDVLKIDRSFVSGLGQVREESAITAAVVSMGQALGLHVIAEGVEGKEQWAELRALGCPLAQGYLFSKPLDPEAASRVAASAAPLA